MRFGLDVAQHQLTWIELLERVRFAEKTGFESAWVFDHFTALYGSRKGPCMDGWTLLPALAASTRSIRLGALVTGVTYRHPSILAIQASTVDNISNGRLEFSLGAAWMEAEHRALGIPFPPARERAERLDEALHVARLLWTKDGAGFEGRHYRLDGATLRPRPVQKPHPPIWVGAGGEKLTMPVAARHADVWHDFGGVRELDRKSKLMDELAAREGRDPASIARATSLSISEPWADVRRFADGVRSAGFSYLIVGWPREGRRRLEQFVEKVLPELAG